MWNVLWFRAAVSKPCSGWRAICQRTWSSPSWKAAPTLCGPSAHPAEKTWSACWPPMKNSPSLSPGPCKGTQWQTVIRYDHNACLYLTMWQFVMVAILESGIMICSQYNKKHLFMPLLLNVICNSTLSNIKTSSSIAYRLTAVSWGEKSLKFLCVFPHVVISETSLSVPRLK